MSLLNYKNKPTNNSVDLDTPYEIPIKKVTIRDVSIKEPVNKKKISKNVEPSKKVTKLYSVDEVNNLKLGICNLTGSPIKAGINSNSNEIINICMQIDSVANCEIINTYDGDVEFNSVYVENADPNKYDAMLVMNSHANFFGGVKNEGVLQLYQFLAKIKCPIFYLFNDTNLPFTQLWGQIKGRTWNTLTEDDVKIDVPFYVISQFNNLDKFIKDKTEKQIPIQDIRVIDFGVWLLQDYKTKYVNNLGEYDFIYGGSFRGGRREAKFKDFFYNRAVNTAIYGSMKAKQFKTTTESDIEPNWLGRVNSTEVINTNAKGFSTIIVGEKNYNNNIETIRLYEAMLANCIVFIDNDFDSEHKILNNDFQYIKSGDEIDSKIKYLKQHPEYVRELIDNQNKYLERKSQINYIMEILSFIKENV